MENSRYLKAGDVVELLQEAVSSQNTDELKKWIEENPHKINMKIGDDTVFSYCIDYEFPLDFIEFLIDKGAVFNTCVGTPPNKMSLFAKICTNIINELIYKEEPRKFEESHNLKIAKLLIKNGADINYESKDCASAAEAIIDHDTPVLAAAGRRLPRLIDSKEKVLKFLFNIRDSEGRRILIDCCSGRDGNKFLERARENHGPAFYAFLFEQCHMSVGRNITAAKTAWLGNKSENSGFGKLPKNVLMGPIAQYLGSSYHTREPGRRGYLHPELIIPTLRGVTYRRGQERSLAKLYSWAEGVREGTSKARATHEAAQGLVSLSKQRPYYTKHGKTVRNPWLLKTNGGRRRRTRRRR